MSKIKINDLHSAGSDLFSDSESFMSDLVDSELGTIHGGWSRWKCWVAVSLISAISVGTVVGTGSPVAVSVATATA